MSFPCCATYLPSLSAPSHIGSLNGGQINKAFVPVKLYYKQPQLCPEKYHSPKIHPNTLYMWVSPIELNRKKNFFFFFPRWIKSTNGLFFPSLSLGQQCKTGRTQLLFYLVRDQLEMQTSVLEVAFATIKMFHLCLAYLSRFLKFDKGPWKIHLDSPSFVFMLLISWHLSQHLVR